MARGPNLPAVVGDVTAPRGTVSPDPAPLAAADTFFTAPPALSLPKGGGAIRSIGEKFSANPVTGTGSMSVPIAMSPGRGGFGPQLALSYDSGAGNGLFGLGWTLPIPSITRKTDNGLPQYRDAEESDVFILAGAEDLVPELDQAGHRPKPQECTVYGRRYAIRRYRPRVEGPFALIERWSDIEKPAETFWRTISRDNVTTIFGRTADSRIVDPADDTRIFAWRVCETCDDKGNASVYDYTREDGPSSSTWSIDESNRLDAQRTANAYQRRIRYGNLAPFFPTYESGGTQWAGPADVANQQWMFEVVFDYGGHTTNAPSPASPWLLRRDPFSSHRSGFEVRTYRLCRRVLMFHHFPGEPGVGADCLVRSTDFTYDEPDRPENPVHRGYTVLRAVTHRAYQRQAPASTTYESRQLPPITFEYSTATVDPTVRVIAAEQLGNLPAGVQGSGYQWLDLDGEGLSGVLAQEAGALYYKPSDGDGRFGPLRVLATQPALAVAGSGMQFLDLAGDGDLDLVDFGGPTPGFHERDRGQGWTRHVPFESLPNIDWSDPKLRFVDLTGDGHADALVAEGDVFTWYPSLDERGFGAAEQARQPRDEDAGPRVVFADGIEAILLADMCGDGLTDLVRVRNGEVCYWPNLGYGRFGRKVTMKNAPAFDHPNLFHPSRLRLADVDGSGPVDIIYLGRDGARIYFNRAGNSLSDALPVDLPIATENLGAVQVADFLGNGTACLVWSSHLPADERHPVRYIVLMGGGEDPAERRKHEKPHLLTRVDNSVGGSIEIEYMPSTRYYLQDKRAGRAWITSLPFPVHCVSRTTVRDKWRGTAFSTTYTYHHGYFDGAEREFRGFARVDQVDVEDYGTFLDGNAASPFITPDKTLYQPPIKTITWFHTGAALDRLEVLGQCAAEYFPAPFTVTNGFAEKLLPDPELPRDLTADEWREALRSLKGMVLRQETYELDVDDLAATPSKHTPVRLFSASTHNCHLERLQQQGDNAHAVFLVTESETLTYQYELALPRNGGAIEPDPRVAHTLNLRHDAQGNLQQAVSIGYGRFRTALPAGVPAAVPRPDLVARAQADLHMAYTETRYTTDVVVEAPAAGGQAGAVRHRRLRLPWEVRTYEISGLPKPAAQYFDIAELRRHELCEDNTYLPVIPPNRQSEPLTKLEYHEQPAQANVRYRRIVQHARTRFFQDEDVIAEPVDPHPFGQHGPRGLKFEDYKLALTPKLMAAIFRRRDAQGQPIETPLLDWPLDNATLARDLLDEPSTTNPGFLTSGYIGGDAIDASRAGEYWMRSGQAGFASNARAAFYLATRYRDPFGNLAKLTYDARHLFVQSTVDALDNAASVERFDYRVLAAAEMVDANGNHTESAFDIRGLVVAAAAKGKPIDDSWESDNLDGFDLALCNPPEAEVRAFCTAAAVDEGVARPWLRNAGARFVYHFGNGANWAEAMPSACGIQRERHQPQVDLDPKHENPIQVALECSDGSGAVLMKKIQAEPAAANGPPRWIVNGLTVLNNKGKAVKQYEPYFSARFGCERPRARGATTVMYYDAAGRLVRTEYPDGTASRVEFSPWHVSTFDQNDTVLESRWYRERLTAIERNADPQTADGEEERLAGLASSEDKRAARLAAKHVGTPALTLLDSLGRDVIALAHNREPDDSAQSVNVPLIDRTWVDSFALTFTRLDAEGKPLWIRDARGNLVMQYITPIKPVSLPAAAGEWLAAEDVPAASAPCYDLAGNLLSQHSMDAGDRWMLANGAGTPLVAWDYNERTPDAGPARLERRLSHARYDALNRPTERWLRVNNDPRALVEAFEYVDTMGLSDAELASAQGDNLIGQPRRHYDPSGLMTVERVNFKSLVEHVTRTLVEDVVAPIVDWNAGDRSALLEDETFHHLTEYDALGRMTRLYNWHRETQPGVSDRVAVYVPGYNRRGLLDTEVLYLHAQKQVDNGRAVPVFDLDPAMNPVVIGGTTWDAKGQKLDVTLGNGTTTSYTYDPDTFRLVTLATTSGVQNLLYTYDPVGNIAHIEDGAQDTAWFSNQQVDASSDYVYDALYRLIEATGRENAAAVAPPPHPEGPWAMRSAPSPDLTHRYTQRYRYDQVANFVEMQHFAPGFPGPPGNSWSRHYTVDPDSNRLSQTWFGNDTGNAVSYRHDPHGCMLNLDRTAPALDIRWDWRDLVRALDLQGGGTAYYNYGIDKQRTRKRLVRNGTGTEDRIYLGGYELYRRRNAQGAVVEQIESLHLFEGEQRVLLVDDVLDATNGSQPGPNGVRISEQTLFRYQYGNHLGSVAAELDEDRRLISREEFYPYGATAYRLLESTREVPAKRYRYTGMERDEESGLSSHGVRYYAPMTARWISADPSGLVDGPNLYCAFQCRPTIGVDRNGSQTGITIDPGRFSGALLADESSDNTPPLFDVSGLSGTYLSPQEPAAAVAAPPAKQVWETGWLGDALVQFGKTLGWLGETFVDRWRDDPHPLGTMWTIASGPATNPQTGEPLGEFDRWLMQRSTSVQFGAVAFGLGPNTARWAAGRDFSLRGIEDETPWNAFGIATTLLTLGSLAKGPSNPYLLLGPGAARSEGRIAGLLHTARLLDQLGLDAAARRTFFTGGMGRFEFSLGRGFGTWQGFLLKQEGMLVARVDIAAPSLDIMQAMSRGPLSDAAQTKMMMQGMATMRRFRTLARSVALSEGLPRIQYQGMTPVTDASRRMLSGPGSKWVKTPFSVPGTQHIEMPFTLEEPVR